MRNIIRIFLSDMKRLSTNVVARVVVIGLAVIPSLYAWFNILSNWAPYESDATGNLSVAVASEDRGAEISGIELNVGNMIISNLKENDSINWVFTDTAYEAVDGVRSGDYYAAFVIDRNFSESLISFLGGDIVHPYITYYENEKKNAIAPKITGKVKTTIQDEIDKAFVSTLAEGALSVGGYLSTDEDGDGGVIDGVLSRLRSMDNDLSTGITILESYISIIDTTENLMDAAKEVSDELDNMMDSAAAVTNTADAAVDSANATVETVSDMVTGSLSDIHNELAVLGSLLDNYVNDVQSLAKLTSAQVESLKIVVNTLKQQFDTSVADVQYNDDIQKKTKKVDDDFDNILSDLDRIDNNASVTASDTATIETYLSGEIENAIADVDALSDSYQSAVKPQLRTTMLSVQNSLNEVKGLLNYSGDSISDVAAILGSYPDMMALGKDNLIATKEEVEEMQGGLRDLIHDVEHLEENEQYTMLLRLLNTDPGEISDFISEPIVLTTKAIYPMENNGSAMAPFYIVLSIWVGSLILVAIMHTKVQPIAGVDNMRTYQEFFGRYIIFFLIGQLQTLITVLGALLYVGIQCTHPFLFYFAMAVTSLCFTMLSFSLTYAFEAVGEAIVVILMVLQVAGAGGTFPVEVLPVAYQVIYKYMPFAYSISAARECVAGMYQNDYWHYLSALGVYIAISLVIGLFVSIPSKKLNKVIKASTEKTDLMV